VAIEVAEEVLLTPVSGAQHQRGIDDKGEGQLATKSNASQAMIGEHGQC
jgi:hypothetical protein